MATHTRIVKGKEKENFTVTGVKRYSHCDATCSRQRNSSTPRFQHQGHHSLRPDGNYTIPPAEPNYNNYNNYNSRPSPAPSSAGSAADITHQFMTYLDENRWQAKLMEYRKELLANVSIFDGKDKKVMSNVAQPVCTHCTINAKMST